MKKIKVAFSVEVPDSPHLNDKDITEWIKFSLRGGSISNENPFYDTEMEAIFGSVKWTWRQR